jgi:hypothetical protein
MRRLTFLIVIAVCSGFFAALPSVQVSGQGSTPSASQYPPDCTVYGGPDTVVLWDCVEKPEPIPDAFLPEDGSTTIGGTRFQVYRVWFKAINASVPEIDTSRAGLEPEFMIVTVLSGDFVLENRDGRARAFIVDPSAEHPVEIVEQKHADPDPGERVYDGTNTYLPGDSGDNCLDMCVVPSGIAVQLIAGDTVYALEGGICIWCLQNRLAENRESDSGALQVGAFVNPADSPDSFSWIQDWTNRQGNPASTTDSSQTDLSQTMMAWAFGPKAACAGG